MLIAEEEAPVLIGQGGSNCKALRETHKVHLTLSKNIDTAERICTIKGSVEGVSECFAQMTDLLVKNAAQIHKNRGGVAPGNVGADKATLAFLLHESLTGLVIGRKGSVARIIFTEIKGKIKVSDACIPHTTDKAVYLTGSPEQMKKIAELVLAHLVDKKPKTEPVINYFPEGRVAYRFEQGNWPARRDYSPPPPRRPDGREREYDRFYYPPPSERFRPFYEERWPRRDYYPPHPRDGYYSPPRGPYFPPPREPPPHRDFPREPRDFPPREPFPHSTPYYSGYPEPPGPSRNPYLPPEPEEPPAARPEARNPYVRW